MKPAAWFMVLYVAFVALAIGLLYWRAYVEKRTGRETRDDDPKPAHDWTERQWDAINTQAQAVADVRIRPLIPVYGCTSPTKCECKDVSSPSGCPYEVVVGTKKGAGARWKETP